VWGTKSRIPFLSKEIKNDVLDHIRTNATSKGIYIDIINGHTQHIHCLISMTAEQNLAKIMQLIKGESSFWINKSKLTKYKFEWAEEYYAVSVSDSLVHNVREYIRNQEEHHRNKTWDDEEKDLIVEYGFTRFVD
jgi:putative transposase